MNVTVPPHHPAPTNSKSGEGLTDFDLEMSYSAGMPRAGPSKLQPLLNTFLDGAPSQRSIVGTKSHHWHVDLVRRNNPITCEALIGGTIVTKSRNCVY